MKPTRNPWRRRLIAAGLVVLVVLLGAIAFSQSSLLTPTGGREYALEGIRAPTGGSTPLVTIEPDHVRDNAPAFYDLLETAYSVGESRTTNQDAQQEIRAYLEDLTGTQDTSIEIQYRDQYFDMRVLVYD